MYVSPARKAMPLTKPAIGAYAATALGVRVRPGCITQTSKMGIRGIANAFCRWPAWIPAVSPPLMANTNPIQPATEGRDYRSLTRGYIPPPAAKKLNTYAALTLPAVPNIKEGYVSGIPS